MKHTELDSWKVAMELTKDIYLQTASFLKRRNSGLYLKCDGPQYQYLPILLKVQGVELLPNTGHF